MSTGPGDNQEGNRFHLMMRELVTLSTASVAWADLSSEEVADRIAGIVVTTLAPDYVLVRVPTASDGDVFDVAQGAEVEGVWEALTPLLEDTGADSAPLVLSGGGGFPNAVAVRFGPPPQRGLVLVSSTRPDFPTEAERWFLQIVCNQLAALPPLRGSEELLEQPWRHSEARNRAILEAALDCIITMDHHGNVVEFNPAAERAFGYSRDEVQLGPYNVLDDKQLEAMGLMEHIRAGFAGETVRIPSREYNLHEAMPDVVPDGERRWLSTVIYPLKDADGTVREVALVHEDVTARELAEEAVRESRERLEFALQAADLGHWELNLTDHSAVRNLRHDQIFGYDSLQQGWSYDKFLEHVVPEDREAVEQAFRRAVDFDESWDFECRIRTVQGAVRWIWARGRLIPSGESGDPRMAGTVADVTERKRIEHELRDARARLDAALEAGAIATWTWDIDGNCVYADKSLATLFGLPPESADGGLLDLYIESMHPEDRPRVKAALQRSVEEGDDYEADYRIIQPDGSSRWVIARGRAELDASGRAVRMPGVLVDITDRKRLEEELRDSEEKLRLLADTIPQLAWMARPDGHIFWYNQRWYEYTGSSPEQMEGWGWQSVHDPGVLPSVMERWKNSIDNAEPFEMVFPLRGADGEYRPFLTRVSPLRDDSGPIVYWCGTNTDISEIKKMEDALRETDRRKDEFLATLAHELRNPLAPIRNSLHILNEPMLDAATSRQTLEMMERQVHHLVRLVDDLLDVSRVMRGRIELRRERIDISTVVARAVEIAHPWIEDEAHTLDVSMPAEALFVDADPVRLSQVVANFLTNSAKYTARAGHIWVTAARAGDEALVTVRDDGIGIAPEALPEVFDLFMQADHAKGRSHGGLGVGLTLAKSLIEMHGGSIEACSGGVGAGSEFTLRLPLAPSATETTDHEALVPRQPRAPSHRILVVDDNEDAATTLGMLLKFQGHEVQVVNDGVSALAAAETFRPAFVLLDLGMPGMDGYEVAGRLRMLPELEDTVLVALTGWGQTEHRQRTAEAGFDHHLVKPVEPSVLQSLLAEHRSAWPSAR